MDKRNTIVGLSRALLLTSIVCLPLVEAQQPAASPQVAETPFDYSRYFRVLKRKFSNVPS